ncbi:VOC family protein [Moritella sp. F3]|uniref:VOC family protein n=1 Tax=Moritella sp. F3 TaxID=2718882 RepID=UPI0018E11404|nr:VOC family protein [Moritella sp. F3]GIC75336.1 VOC family protein [Moritella sp. F1]GIC80481.1 VOC family protein [Moritella sp. F3]
MQYQDLTQQWPAFSDAILAFSQQLGLCKQGNLKSEALWCDHVALRVNDIAVATSLLAEFKQRGEVISDSMINGRPIYIIVLDEPVQLGDWQIDCVELPFPGKYYPQQGWEHIELVLPGNATTMAELEQSLRMVSPNIDAVLASDSSIKIKHSAPQAAGETLANPTIAFKQGDICIKVHSAGIKAVVASETAA